MQIKFNWPDYLIPFVVENEAHGYIFDFFMNSILLQNDAAESKRITRIIVDLRGSGETIWRWELPQPAIWDHLKVDVDLASTSIQNKTNVVGSHLAPMIGDLQPGPTLQPDEQAIIRRFPVRFTTHKLPDQLVIRVFSGTHLIGRNSIPLKSVKSSPDFVFPVSGVWQVFHNFDQTMIHRQYACQEFALDLIQLSDTGKILKNTSTGPEDFVCFNKPVVAMSGGKVVRAESGIPDNSRNQIPDRAEFEDRLKNLGYISCWAGNHIVIEHPDGCWSFYAHLKEGSIEVAPGDTVQSGQVIARVGNSGYSDQAHLHFQVNTGPNPLGDRSLPMQFCNLRDFRGNDLKEIMHNLSIVHTAGIPETS